VTPLEFLNLLWQGKPEESYVLIWALQGKQSHWFRSLPQAAESLEPQQSDVYVGVGLAKQDYGLHQRCLAGEITGIAGVWADFDIKSPAHPKDLPASIQEALTLVPASLPPTIVTATGNGLQAWWLFKEPWIFETESDRKEATILSSRFQTFLGYRSSERGWGFDRLSDLARVLRLPGTTNGKDPSHPKPVTVHSFGNHRYNPSDIEDYLEQQVIPHPEAENLATKNWAACFADTPLAINLDARIPQEQLDTWLATDLRFKNTWFRQRPDLTDQSQSGYDMALACFGVNVGLGAQQIIDLVIHHRFLHRVKQRTRLDYFQRTIAKAETNRCKPGSNPVALDSQDKTDHIIVDPTTARGRNWDHISDALGIRIYRMIKITGKNPIYRMEGEGGKIEFSNIRKISSQDNFRTTIAAAINKFPRKLKPAVWTQISQLMLDSLTEEDGGEEMDLQGSARMYVHQYLSETGFIESVEGESSQNARKPLILDSGVTVCSSDLQIHINKTTGQNLSVPQVTAMLSVLSAQSFRHRGKFSEQSRWKLPSAEFDPAQYSAQYREDIDHAE